MGVGGQRHSPTALASGKSTYPLYKKLGGPQGRSGRVGKISPPPGFDPRTVQPVASRYTDWAILAQDSRWAYSFNHLKNNKAIFRNSVYFIVQTYCSHKICPWQFTHSHLCLFRICKLVRKLNIADNCHVPLMKCSFHDDRYIQYLSNRWDKIFILPTPQQKPVYRSFTYHVIALPTSFPRLKRVFSKVLLYIILLTQ